MVKIGKARKEAGDVVKESQAKSFEQILLEAIDDALSSLGENIKTAIYFHVEKSFNVKRDEIPKRLTDFLDALERIFSIGARHLEILFMKSIHEKIRITCKWPEYEWALSKCILPELTFQDYVRLMQQKFENKKSNIEIGVWQYETEVLKKRKS
ncbi:MAG: hypothetical protein WHU54_03715 [Candidatus Bathyarchaeia archaeon]